MNDPFQAHALFALMFDCEACKRIMEFSSVHTELTDEWYRELAKEARAQGWFVAPANAQGEMDVMRAWCDECAAKPGFVPSQIDTMI